MTEKLQFTSDYMEGAHPAILQRLEETNLVKTPGYGNDPFSDAAREKIRAACAAPEADIFFLVGGTQANAVVISALLSPWQGVCAAGTGHIATHEAGAIEAGGHKVLTLPGHNGKIDAEELETLVRAWQEDGNREHIVMPGMVYISQPTELGTLYSLEELEALSRVCRREGLPLYLDGARLAYALGCPENDASLPDIARLCAAFYIGGTKCGALFGEAVVFPRRGFVPQFFTLMKQHGALLAKGWIAGLQFDVLFTDGLYLSLGRSAVAAADRIRAALDERGIPQAFPSPTNQIFLLLPRERAASLLEKTALGFWENVGDQVILRLATSWATAPEEAEAFISLLET